MSNKLVEEIDDVLHDLDHGNITRGEAKSKLLLAIAAKVDEPLAVQGPTPMYLKAQKLLWDEAIKEHQKLYHENQRLQCELDTLKNNKGDIK